MKDFLWDSAGASRLIKDAEFENQGFSMFGFGVISRACSSGLGNIHTAYHEP